jgi:hypothetical protein
MTTAPTTLGVVVSMTPDSYIRPTSSLWPGVSSGSLELVGDVGSSAGLSLTFDGPAALERLLDVGQTLLAQMRRGERQAVQEEAWAEVVATTGRAPLRAVSPDDVLAEADRVRSLLGSPA